MPFSFNICQFINTFAAMIVHIFNPEHDIALAADKKHWTAPHAGRKLRADLGWLPALWADDGDIVIVDDVAAAINSVRHLKQQRADVRFLTLRQLNSIDSASITGIYPWGWDKAIVHQLELAGVSGSLLPSEAVLGRQRQLSDRATAARLLQHLCQQDGNLCGESYTVTDIAQLHEHVTHLGKAVVKSPWSSSGRGVRYVDADYINIIRWSEKVLATQGHLMVEPYLNKLKDFGMEFTAHADGRVTYDGLSLFNTVNGAYQGSILATEAEKREAMAAYIDLQLLDSVTERICQWMEREIASAYTGPFGIDMMVVAPDADGGRNLLQPCVEINLRRTMGHVALAISPSEPCQQMIMRIGYEGTAYHFRIYNGHELYF